MFRVHTTRTNLLLLFCWWHIPLIFSSRTLHTDLTLPSLSSSSSSSYLRSLTSEFVTSNSQKQDGITFDDDDDASSQTTQPTTVVPTPTKAPISPASPAPTLPPSPEIQLGAFHLLIQSSNTQSGQKSGNGGPMLTRDDLVPLVESIILDSLQQQWNGTYSSIVSVEIQPIPGEYLQSSSFVPKPRKRNKVKRDNRHTNHNTQPPPQQQLPKPQKRQINNRFYHTLPLQNLRIQFHKPPLPIPQTLKDVVQTAVRSSTHDGSIPILQTTLSIYQLDLVWDGEPFPPSPTPKPPPPTDTHGKNTVPPTQTPRNTTTRIGTTDTNPNRPSTTTNTTETRLYGPLIGAGVGLLLIGLFLVRRSNRQSHSRKQNTQSRADLVATQMGAEPSMSFLNRVPQTTRGVWRGLSGSTDVESIQIQDIEEVVVRVRGVEGGGGGGEDSYSDVSSITGPFGKQQRSVEHDVGGECTWIMNGTPSPNVIEDECMPPVEDLVPYSQLPRNLLCSRSDVSSRSAMDDSNLLFSSGRDSDVSMSSRSAFGPDSNCWDLAGEEYEEDDGVAMVLEEDSKGGVGGGSGVGGRALKEMRRLDAKILNRHESFLDHNLSRDRQPQGSTKRDDDLSLCDGLPSVS